MTAAAIDGAARRHAVVAADVVDADYEIVHPAGPGPAPEAPAPQIASPSGMDMLRRTAAGPAAGWMTTRGGPLFWVAGAGVVLAAFWVSGGHALVRHSPLLSAVQAPKAAFSVAGVSSRFDLSGGKPVLLVDGEAANDGAEAGVLPPLEICVAAPDGRVTRYTLGTSGRLLGPGQRLAFSSRLDVPKNGVGTVSVTFTR